MMKKILSIATVIMTAVSCTNPFLSSWNTPYSIPDFGKVKEKHYLPAVEEGIRQQQAEIDAIIANQEAPTFANVVEAYEASGAILDLGIKFFATITSITAALIRRNYRRC